LQLGINTHKHMCYDAHAQAPFHYDNHQGQF